MPYANGNNGINGLMANIKKDSFIMAKRRGNSEGSIHQRKNGNWRAQITLDGRRLSFSAKTRQECHAWLKQINHQIDSGLSYNGANMLFQVHWNNWLDNVEQNRKYKTYLQYKRIGELYITPKFGKCRLRDLKPTEIEKYLDNLKKYGYKDPDKPDGTPNRLIGDRTCQLIHAIMHVALEAAVFKSLIGYNPMDRVHKPTVKNPRPIVTLELEEIQQLLIAAEDDPNAMLYHLAVVTGLREGEILGLKWQDVDWNKSRLKVQRQIQRIPKQGLVFSTPKTKAGIRVITIGAITLEKLREHRDRQAQEKLAMERRWQENDLIFPTVIGTPLDPHNLLKEFKALLLKAGLPVMRFHDLRHTSITLVLNEIGAPIKEAQKRAGHASPSTTINIYGGEATSKLDDMVAQSLDELVTPRKIDLHHGCTKEESLPYR